MTARQAEILPVAPVTVVAARTIAGVRRLTPIGHRVTDNAAVTSIRIPLVPGPQH